MKVEGKVPKRLFRYKELSDYLSTPVGTLRNMVCYRKIPYKKIGGRIYFDKKSIDRWLDKMQEMEPLKESVVE